MTHTKTHKNVYISNTLKLGTKKLKSRTKSVHKAHIQKAAG